MNKKTLFLRTIFFVIFLILVNLSKIYAYKIVRVNEVYFSGITSINFTIKNHCITQGQPFQQRDGSLAPRAKHKRGWHGIYFMAGRKSSKYTVNCLEATMLTPDKYHPYNENFYDNFNFSHYPYKLHFAVMGTLTIDGKNFDNMILAQGHVGATNNWWIGGSNCSKYGYEDQLNCTSADKSAKWCFIRGKTQDTEPVHNAPNHIDVKKGGCNFHFGE